MEYTVIITVSNQAENIVGKLSKCAIAMLPQAEYSVIRQEGECGYTTNALTSDDFSVYNVGKVAAQQKCLAHLRRHFKKVLGLPGNNNAAVAQIFLSLIDEAFIAHESWRKTKDRLFSIADSSLRYADRFLNFAL
jgi:hypothetical protein